MTGSEPVVESRTTTSTSPWSDALVINTINVATGQPLEISAKASADLFDVQASTLASFLVVDGVFGEVEFATARATTVLDFTPTSDATTSLDLSLLSAARRQTGAVDCSAF